MVLWGLNDSYRNDSVPGCEIRISEMSLKRYPYLQKSVPNPFFGENTPPIFAVIFSTTPRQWNFPLHSRSCSVFRDYCFLFGAADETIQTMPFKLRKTSKAAKKPIKKISVSVITRRSFSSRPSSFEITASSSISPPSSVFVVSWTVKFNGKDIWQKALINTGLNFQKFHVSFIKQIQNKITFRGYNLIKYSSKAVIFCKNKNLENNTNKLKKKMIEIM